MIRPDPNHPSTDLDATFAATLPKDTYRLMEALRKAGVYFDVTVNGPKDDPEPARYDIFWFRNGDDQEIIARVLSETIGSDSP
jgi:hypothetical protein